MGGENPTLVDGEWKVLAGVNFLSGGEQLRRSAFDHWSLFQSKKHHSVNIEHQLKLKLAWPLYKEGGGPMTTVKNEVFIGLLDENFYLVGRELTFGEGRNYSKFGVNEQSFS